MVNQDRRREIVQYLQQISRKPDGSERTRIMNGHQGVDNIGDFFIQPCLKKCKRYRRSTGSFQSSALKVWAQSLYQIIDNNTKIEILTHLHLDLKTIKELETLTDEEKKEEKFFNEQNKELRQALRDAKDFSKNPEKHHKSRNKILAYLINNKQLKIKFAYLKGQDYSDIEKVREQFHMKFGYFIFDEGIKVAFEGGFNETDTGLRRSAESSQIKFSYRGVELSKQELEDIINDTDSIWENGTDTVKVRGVSQKTLAVCREISKGFKPTKKMLDEIDGEDPGDENENTEGDSNPIFPEKTWTHQEKAVNEFLDNKRGILEMATGTGKTRTALIIMSILLERGEINSVIIGIDGDDLLAQWVEDIAEFKMNFSDIYPKLDGLVIQKHFTHEGETFKEHQDFAFSPEDSILLISTHQPEALKTTINILGQKAKKTLIIYDEVHTLASPGRIKVLSNSHDAFEYRFGMSATPKKNYDPEGKLNAFLIDEVGEIMDFKFGLKEAIQGGFLCEFDYHVISYDLNDEERKKIQKFFATCKQAEKDKNYEKVERMRINMANVRKLAASKPGLLYDFIKEKKHRIKYLTSTIIFTQEKVQGKIVGSEVLHELGNTSYHIYFKEKNQPKRVLQGYLDELKDGHKDCLIACKKLSEGIDIQGLKNVILLASDRGKLRTIQRVGRCLRIDPDDRNKRATVIDFQQRVEKEDEGFDGDNERVKFLTELAKVKRSKLSKLKGTIK